MDIELQQKIKQFKKLIQFKNYSDSQILDAAQMSIKNQKLKSQYDFILEGLPVSKPSDKKILKQILADYVSEVYIENKRQLFQLKDLVFIEYKKRTTRENIQAQEIEKENSVASYAYDAYHKLIERAQALAEKIFGTNLKDDKSVLQQLFSRMRLWMNLNQGSRSFLCPHCGKMLMAKIRMDKYEVDKHPFFQDRLLTNKFLMEQYIIGKKVIVDEKFIAQVLGCSELYTRWFLDRYLKKSNPLYEKYLDKIKDDK